MKKFLAVATAAAMLATGAIAANASTGQERSEERLAEMLQGYEPGTPVSCISAFRSNRLTVLPYVGLVYEDGDTIYVARAVQPRMLSHDDVPVIERFSSQICRTDVMRTVDRNMPNFSGVLFIEDFVPYTRVETAQEG
jgi:hypothetical protein